MEKLSLKEKAIYDYIVKTIECDGYSPSVRDIRNALAIKSTSTVHKYLEQLENKGYIKKEQGKSRTLRVDAPYKIPLLGRIAAGTPVFAQENYEGYVAYIPPVPVSLEDLFALRVSGESMIGIGIMNGDIIIVRHTDYAENGEIIVALIEDEATVKTFYAEKGMYRLQPENPSMAPIFTKELKILGKVIASYRCYI